MAMYVCSETKKINDFKYGLYKILFQTSYSRSPHAQPYSSPSRSPTRRKYVIAGARANDPPRDDRPQDVSIRHIKDTLLAQSGSLHSVLFEVIFLQVALIVLGHCGYLTSQFQSTELSFTK